ncbi:MAG TPA: ABC transporter permease [Bryobacteraceae bacterium]|nr:ABC transporter permease [Bryobacteraceae bacterium]
MTGLLQDLRYAARTLAKSPGFTLVALATLALGIGANTAIFSFVDAVLLKPLPYTDADRIVMVMEKPPRGGRNGISTLNYLDWKNQNTVFEYMTAFTNGNATLTGMGEPIQLRGGNVAPEYFNIFGVHAALGRTLVAGEDQPGKDHVLVLSHTLWQTQFGGDPKLIGKTVRLDGEPYTVVGVLPAGGSFDRLAAQFYKPLVFKPENMTRNFHWFVSFAKLKPGVTLGAARQQMDAIGGRIAHDFPESNKGWGVVVDRYADILVNDDLKRSLYVLLAAVGMVLLISCANIANLMLVRGASRDREIAIRTALGGERARIVRQFLTESLLLSVSGGILGLALGYAGMAGLKASIPNGTLPAEAAVALDSRVLIFTLVLSVVTGLVFGIAPALAITRSNLADVMKDRARNSSAGLGRKSLRGALVVAQVALAFILLVGAGLLLRSFSRMLTADLGFDSTNVETAQMPIPTERYPDPARLNEYVRSVVAGIGTIPGVREVAFSSALPLRGWGYGMPFQIAGRPTVDRANRPVGFFKMVTPTYFQVLGMRVLKGRLLNEHDLAGAQPVAVINETLARKYFENENPIGQRILVQQIIPGKTQLGPEIPWEVAGVVADERVTSLDNKQDSPGLYVTNEQSPAYFGGLVVRATMNPALLEKSIRKAVYDVNKDQALTEMKTLDELKTESVSSDRLRSVLLGVFAAIALALSAVGIYGVVSYTVAQRTNEMGIRAALGASSGNLLGLALQGGMWLTLIGLAVGFGAALALTRLLSTLLFGIGAWDAVTLVTVAALLAAVGLWACFIPARRAARVDPMVALRYE